MAKLTPALLKGLTFFWDLMQPMAYFAAVAGNSKYVNQIPLKMDIIFIVRFG